MGLSVFENEKCSNISDDAMKVRERGCVRGVDVWGFLNDFFNAEMFCVCFIGYYFYCVCHVEGSFYCMLWVCCLWLGLTLKYLMKFSMRRDTSSSCHALC